MKTNSKQATKCSSSLVSIKIKILNLNNTDKEMRLLKKNQLTSPLHFQGSDQNRINNTT